MRETVTSALCQFQTRAPQQTAHSLDRLVGAAEQREAERLGGVHVDNQLDLHHLLEWEIGRLFTIENPARVEATASPNLVEGCEGRLEVVFAAGVQDMDSLPNRALRHPNLSGKVLGSRITRAAAPASRARRLMGLRP
jgi:hypothetical protein